VPASTPESKAMAKELKRRGFRFIGPTTAYALMQAAGMVNDHLEGCELRRLPEIVREGSGWGSDRGGGGRGAAQGWAQGEDRRGG
jgi:hypothetical protein